MPTYVFHVQETLSSVCQWYRPASRVTVEAFKRAALREKPDLRIDPLSDLGILKEMAERLMNLAEQAQRPVPDERKIGDIEEAQRPVPDERKIGDIEHASVSNMEGVSGNEVDVERDIIIYPVI